MSPRPCQPYIKPRRSRLRGLLVAALLAAGPVTSLRAAVFLAEDFDTVPVPALPSGWSSAGTGEAWFSTGASWVSSPNSLTVTRSGPDDASTQTLTSPSFPVSPLPLRLRFHHKYDFDYSARGRLEVAYGDGVFQDIVAAGGYFIANGYPAGSRWTGSQSGWQEVTAVLPPAGGAQTTRLRWVFTQPGSFFSYASQSWSVDSVTVDDSLVSFADDLTVTLTESSDPVAVGAAVAFTATVKNSGPSAATGVVLTNWLPAGVNVTSGAASQGTTTNLGGVWTSQLGVIPGGGTATVVFSVETTAAGLLTNRATVTRAELDVFLLNNAATITTLVTPPVLTVSDATATETNSGNSAAVFSVFLQPPALAPVAVDFSTLEGTAGAGADFTATNGTLLFAPGETVKTVSVAVRDDLLDENSETFLLTLTPPAGVLGGRTNATGSIMDNDPVPSLYVIDADVVEGDNGVTNALFRVFLSQPSGVTNVMQFYTGNGTAEAGTDYVSTNGLLYFQPGQTEQFIAVQVLGDRWAEPSEYFYLQLEGYYTPPYGTLSGAVGFGYIQTDDGLPGKLDSFTWDALASPQAIDQPVAVTIRARDYSGDPATNFTGTAALSGTGFSGENGEAGTFLGRTNTSDYESYQWGYTVGWSFTPATNLQVTHLRRLSGQRVSLWRDDDGELLGAAEFSGYSANWAEVELAAPVQLQAGVRYVVGALITNSSYARFDPNLPPAFAHGMVNGRRNQYGAQRPLQQDYYGYNWLVDFRYRVGTVTPLVIAPPVAGPFTNGVWSGNLQILTAATSVVLRATAASGASGISDRLALTIADDVGLTLTAAAGPVAAGAPTTQLLRVFNSGPATATGVAVTNPLPANATILSALPSVGSVTTNAGAMVWSVGSLPGATNAQLVLTLVAASPAIVTNQAFVTRDGPDGFPANNSASAVSLFVLPALGVSNVTVIEPDSGVTNAAFLVSLDPPSPVPVSVAFATLPGTATAGLDFTPTNGVLTFAPGVTVRTVNVAVRGDLLSEDDETLWLTFTNTTQAQLPPGPALLTISDNDPLPSLSVVGTTVTEGNTGARELTFVLLLSQPSGRTISCTYGGAYYYSSQTATPYEDYLPAAGLLVFPPGETVRTVSVTILGDATVEPNESVFLYIDSITNSYIFSQSYSYIVNDDGVPGELYDFAVLGPTNHQYVGEAFPATIVARDYYGATVAGVNSAVTLQLRGVSGQQEHQILGPVEAGGTFTGNWTFGYAFTPDTTLLVTHFRHRYGVNVALWTAAGQLLSSRPINGSNPDWQETPLDAPVTLLAGQEYVVAAYLGDGPGYFRTDGPASFPHGQITRALAGSGFAKPTLTSSARWPLVDLRYLAEAHVPLAMDPALPVPLTNGVWSGFLTPLDPGRQVAVQAVTGTLSNSSSVVFDVLGPRLSLDHSPAALVLSWPAATPGYLLESSPAPTNGSWSSVPAAPAEWAGRKSVTNAPNGDALFYRLRRP